jgi:hypothetical protein
MQRKAKSSCTGDAAVYRIMLEQVGARERSVLLISSGSLSTQSAPAGSPDTPLVFESDLVIATTGRPGLVKPQIIRRGQVVFSPSKPEKTARAAVRRLPRLVTQKGVARC